MVNYSSASVLNWSPHKPTDRVHARTVMLSTSPCGTVQIPSTSAHTCCEINHTTENLNACSLQIPNGLLIFQVIPIDTLDQEKQQNILTLTYQMVQRSNNEDDGVI